MMGKRGLYRAFSRPEGLSPVFHDCKGGAGAFDNLEATARAAGQG